MTEPNGNLLKNINHFKDSDLVPSLSIPFHPFTPSLLPITHTRTRTGAREAAFRNIKSIAECLADELINAAKVIKAFSNG